MKFRKYSYLNGVGHIISDNPNSARPSGDPEDTCNKTKSATSTTKAIDLRFSKQDSQHSLLDPNAQCSIALSARERATVKQHGPMLRPS